MHNVLQHSQQYTNFLFKTRDNDMHSTDRWYMHNVFANTKKTNITKQQTEWTQHAHGGYPQTVEKQEMCLSLGLVGAHKGPRHIDPVQPALFRFHFKKTLTMEPVSAKV